MKRLFGTWIVLALLSTGTLYAQDIYGSLTGAVVDENEGPLVGANIVISGPSIQGVEGGVTNEIGQFRVLALPVGLAQVQISFVGFETATLEGVRIRLGEMTSLGIIQLQPEDIQLEGVTVTGDRPVVDMSTTTTGSNMSAETFTLLPMEREISSVLSMLPQANASYLGDATNIAGATGNENAYFFDGVNTSSPLKNQSAAELPYNFIKEVQVKTGGYEAEYGRAMGGIINVLTESGSNTLKASAFSFLTNNSLSARSRRSFTDQISTDDFLRYDVGFGVGGPIIKDQLWYYAAYNRKVESEDVNFDAIGRRTNTTISNIYAGKLTWNAGPSTNVEMSAFGNPNTGDHTGGAVFWGIPESVKNVDTMVGKTEGGTHTLALNATHVIGDDVLIDARASWYRVRDLLEGATEQGRRDPLVVEYPGVWSGGFPAAVRERQRRSSASLSTTWYVGTQTVKAGFQYEDTFASTRRIVRSETGPNVEEITGQEHPFDGPPGAGAIDQVAPSQWHVMFQNDGAAVKGKNSTVFAQISGKVSDRLTANLGVRWDHQAFDARDYDYHYSLPGQWQPRAGVIYELDDSGNQKLFAHAGRFYVQVPINASTIYMVPPLCWFAIYYEDPMLDSSEPDLRCADRSPVELIDGDLSGMFMDAVTGGYQGLIGTNHRIGVSATYRNMGKVLTTGFQQGLWNYVLGNPGEGNLYFLPEPVRTYDAVEVTYDRVGAGKLQYGLSYVLSRNHGNFSGMYGQYTGQDSPNATIDFSTADQVESAGVGPLPNDRTRVFKTHGSYRFDAGLNVGTFFTWQTGTPMTESERHPWLFYDYTIVGGRGGLGRTSNIWDLSFRFSYDLNYITNQRFEQKVILDILHAFSNRKAVHFETNNTNPNFMEALRYQPPMTIRLGVELEF